MKASGIIHERQQWSMAASRVQPKRIMSGFRFAEGVLWHPAGYVLFSDVAANKIFQVFLNGVTHVLLHHSGSQYVCDKYLSDKTGSNGLAFNKEGDLVFCQHANHSIARLDKTKNVVQLCTSYNGRPFNSPNDLAVRSDGGIYFTDPPYGLKKEILNPDIFQPHAGIYRFHHNQVTLLSADFRYPNGICFSPDERSLFVSSNHPEEQMIRQFTLSPEGDITGSRVFARINADGIKTDKSGNLYAATDKGILILSPDGEEMGLVALKEPATNICFGGKEGNTLFATTYHALYSLELSFNGTGKSR